ncbi:hypothetical protein [Frigoribacterium sp. PhB24]|uniref:hypothetical protein n=1 Tax=Frigoribacterium sp. PhB24 TaxID=2485204 RepID=UPI000FAD2A0F|nr:hypothetical protein [Frigoribacterium sp. PhB24]ROS49530.1 hypothetical protein EDF50_2445 [Frigoribacterium sp. PhB24]
MTSLESIRFVAPVAAIALWACLLAAPAHAVSRSPYDTAVAAASAVAAVAPPVAAPAELSTEARGSGPAGTAGPVDVDLPADPTEGIGVDSGLDLRIGLPFDEQAGDPVIVDSSTLVIDNRNGSSSVPSVREDGSLRIATVIDSPTAPSRYEYPLVLPAGGSLALGDDGGAIIVLADGTPLGRFDAPWAYQADGTSVDTSFEISGATLTQVVHHDAGMAYPVIADPSYKTTTFYWSRTTVENMFARKGNVGQFCRVVPTSYLVGVGCGITPALDQAITQAHYQKKRIKAVFYNCAANYCNYYKFFVIA